MFKPDDIGMVFGQDHLLDVLHTWTENHFQIPQSLLFYGPYGTGKTTIARILADKLTSTKKDLIEVNAADARGIDEVRSWTESSRFMPFGTGSKVYIIDELHQMTQAAQSAMLKVIEEPPKGIYYFLCTTEPSRLLPTIRSRCNALELKLLTKEDTANLLRFIYKKTLSEDVMDRIHKKSGGHARDAVKMADLAVLSGVVSVEDLDCQVGMGLSELATLLDQILWHGLSYGEAAKLAEVQDDVILAESIDSAVDSAVYLGNPIVLKSYHDLLTMRCHRKDYKINSKQQALHFLSKVYS